ncbi:glycosyltransferase family 2 protein [Tichowtungia aerotolerans]|uniref:Glycosyltransferase n=1 Tax=Tichowtungia aerotolerans TaxID=2697043 RepID=A0A6P1M820_9BACT|nr:glycosyltransferase family 2 protein [Tichowtungia aerotolerans]QHI70192.1 glycosyltransferase [Tichowtungia aerotolerans]
MKFSVVTPCYNYRQYLGAALESVLDQVAECPAGLQVEHIVIDGGSTDGTVDILGSFESQVLEKELDGVYAFRWVSEPDRGQSDAINKGLRIATGDVVCWLNADERYVPGALAKVARVFHETPSADVIYGEPVFTDKADKVIKEKKDHRFDRNILLYYGCYITSCCTFWRRRILDEGHYLDESYRATMDYEYYVRLMHLGYNFLFLPVTIASFIWHDQNVSTVFADVRRAERLQVQRQYGVSMPFFKQTPTCVLDGLAKVFKLKRGFMTLPRRICCR